MLKLLKNIGKAVIVIYATLFFVLLGIILMTNAMIAGLQ